MRQKKQRILAVSGVKNFGKTTLITKLLTELKKRGLEVAVIKHDGHDFQADVPDTDSWKYAQAGACGTCVFSEQKHMVIKYMSALSTEKLIQTFPEADVILLEGVKYSEYPKIEVIRRRNSSKSVCDPSYLWGGYDRLQTGRIGRDVIWHPIFWLGRNRQTDVLYYGEME